MKIKLYLAIILTFGFLKVNGSSVKLLLKYEIADKDSIIVSFGDKTRLIIYGENRTELQKIMKYDLNALLNDLQVRLENSDADTTFLKEAFNGNDYLRDTLLEKVEKDYVRIGIRGIHIKDGETRVTINAQGLDINDKYDSDSLDIAYRRNGKRFYNGSRNSSPRKGFNVAMGLNTYGTNQATPGYNKEDYALRSFGSRFVSLGYVAGTTIARGKNAKFGLDFGVDFSWNNLMFDSNKTLVKTPNRVNFEPISMDGKEINLSKSKLVLPYVNLSLMPTLSFSKSFISYISGGVYGGYLLGSYTKTREEGSKDKDHVRMNYHVNDLRYGIGLELGIRSFPDFFVNYDLNNVFVDSKGPSVRMLNFGIRLF